MRPPRVSDAIFGARFKADPSLSGLWDTAPNPPAHLGRVARRELLGEADPRFRDLFNNRLVAIAITSPNEHWLKVNNRWCEMTRGLRDLRTQIDEISGDIQSLSHDLHAAKLEYLGAVAGIKSWCMEFGARFKIQISFSGKVRTQLPQSVGICLFRVVQEALHNVVKHSGAKRAEVSVRECPNEVHLVIRDAGRGFDANEVRGGLGLISMRERVRLIHGALTVDSTTKCGTTIYVRVPLCMSRDPREIARSIST